jgi:CheY-like chemotaxis protein
MDDEPAIRVAMIALLESWGHRVVAAAGPGEAIAALAGGPPPDLIISDYRLRDGLDGLTAIRQVQDATAARIPAILVTGDTAPENIRLALSSGYPLLHKPLSDARLRAAITSLLRRGRMAKAPQA